MTICFANKGSCSCQPDEGSYCPNAKEIVLEQHPDSFAWYAKEDALYRIQDDGRILGIGATEAESWHNAGDALK